MTICGPRTWNMREVPALFSITSKIVFAGKPAFMPSTKASAADTLWIATSRLATNFIRLPLPNAPR